MVVDSTSRATRAAHTAGGSRADGPRGTSGLKPSEALTIWRRALVETVRREEADLSARQLAMLLTIYQTPPPHTVRGLAATLNISKPAVTRALDKLQELGFTKRKTDDADRRNVLVQRTVRGSVYLSDFGELIAKLARDV